MRSNEYHLLTNELMGFKTDPYNYLQQKANQKRMEFLTSYSDTPPTLRRIYHRWMVWRVRAIIGHYGQWGLVEILQTDIMTHHIS